MIKRYGMNWTPQGVLHVAAECGDWCRYADIAPLEAKAAMFDELFKAALAAVKFVDPRATTFDMNATSVKHGDIRETLVDVLTRARAMEKQ